MPDPQSDDQDQLDPKDTYWVCSHGTLHPNSFMAAACRSMTDFVSKLPPSMGATLECGPEPLIEFDLLG